MANNLNKEIEQLKIIYQEIIQGYSPINGYVIRHLNELDNIDVLRRRITYYDKFVKEGVPTTEQRLKELNDSQQWTKDNEDKIDSIRQQILDNERMLPNILAVQQPMIQAHIDKMKKELATMVVERVSLIGATVEEFSEKEAVNYFLFISMFKNREMTIPFFDSWEDCENLEDDELSKYSGDVDRTLRRFSEEKLRDLSVMPFFINFFSFSKDSVGAFINRPISELTSYQMSLFSLGSRNISVLQHAKGSPPDLIGETKISDVTLWYDKQYQMISTNQQAPVTSTKVETRSSLGQ